MKLTMTRYFLALFLFLPLGGVFAGNIALNVGGYTSPYIGHKTYGVIWPELDIDTGFFFIHDRSAGVHLWRDSDQQLNVQIQYLALHLKPSSNHNEQMKQLDRRRSTLLGGMSYQLTTDLGQIDVALLGDMLSNSDSLIADLKYTYDHQVNAKTFLSPYIGAFWTNRKHNQYYFGITQKESARSGFEVYRPGSSINYYAGLSMDYYFNQHWSALIDYRFYLLRDKIKPSPIVKHGYSHLLTVGLAFNF